MKKKFLLMGTDVRQQYLKEMLEQQGHHTEWIQTLTSAGFGQQGVL